ncbi:MAG TPA: hypothetical protein VF523_03145 [Burkholderiales bacterium]
MIMLPPNECLVLTDFQVFFQPAPDRGTLLVGQMNAELHFFAVRPQQQPPPPCAPGFHERNLNPVTVEFETFCSGLAPAFDDDLVIVKRNAFVIAGALFHISECQEHHQDVQACERKNQPGAIESESEGNRENHHRKGTHNEKPAARRERIISSRNEREIRRALRCIPAHLQTMPQSRFSVPLRRAARHKPVAF